MVDFIWAASVGPATAPGVDLGPEVIQPLMTKQVEPMVEATPSFQQTPMLEGYAVDKGNGVFVPIQKEKLAPPMD